MTKNLTQEATRILSPDIFFPGAAKRLVKAYKESWRHFHGVPHIVNGLELLEDEPDPNIRQSVARVYVFHDTWLKIGRVHGINEANSARWAVSELIFSSNPEVIRLSMLFQEAIPATASHTLIGVRKEFHPEVSLLLDIDLWGLGQSRTYFRENTEKIWLENQPVYTREEFDFNLSKWAKSFLERKNIYHTKRYAHLERQARKNLASLVK